MNVPVIIQKNKVLVGIITVSVLVSLYLVYLNMTIHQEIQMAMAEIEQDDIAIKQINNRKDPNPVKTSQNLIEQNTKELESKIAKMQRTIGNPYRQNLLAFLSDLESTAQIEAKDGQTAAVELVPISYTEDEILKLFAKVYTDYYADRKNDTTVSKDNDILISERNVIFENFKNALTMPSEDKEMTEEEIEAYKKKAKAKFNFAFKRFWEGLQQQNWEEIDKVDAEHIMMHALGLPRTMTRMNCKNFVDEVLTTIQKNPDIIPGLSQYFAQYMKSGKDARENKTVTDRIAALTSYSNQLPPPDNVVAILRHYRIIDDLFARMRQSGIMMLRSLNSPLSSPSPSGNLFGDPVPDVGNDYRRFVYRLEIVSSMSSIRKFINCLHSGYQQNRVYDIEEIIFKKYPDEVKEADDAARAIKKAQETAADEALKELEKKDQEAGYGDNKSEKAPLTEKQKQLLEQKRQNDICSDPGYGKTILGSTDTVLVVIKLNYLVYTGDVLVK